MTQLPPITLIVFLAVGLCAVVLLPLSQRGMLQSLQASESDVPCQEERENSEEECVACSASRMRQQISRNCDWLRCLPTADNQWLLVTRSEQPPAVEGHRWANGLCAPLLT